MHMIFHSPSVCVWCKHWLLDWLIDAAGAQINNWLDYPPIYGGDQSIPAHGNVRGVACLNAEKKSENYIVVAFAWIERITDNR